METDAAVDKSAILSLAHSGLEKPAGFPTVPTGPTAVNQQTTNRTLHLLQKPDIFICYRQKKTVRDYLQLCFAGRVFGLLVAIRFLEALYERTYVTTELVYCVGEPIDGTDQLVNGTRETVNCTC